MSETVHICQKCGARGNGLQVGIDPISEIKLCRRCMDNENISRGAGEDWGDRVQMKTDPHIGDPLPPPTLEEALGKDVLDRNPELKDKTLEDFKGSDNTRIDKLEAKVDSLDTKLDKILERL